MPLDEVESLLTTPADDFGKAPDEGLDNVRVGPVAGRLGIRRLFLFGFLCALAFRPAACVNLRVVVIGVFVWRFRIYESGQHQICDGRHLGLDGLP